MSGARKPLYWVASSLKDLKSMPEVIQKSFGTALRHVQYGESPYLVKALSGFRSGSVLQLSEDHDRSTYRAVYTVKFPGAVYVLHVFQKKSKHGVRTPRVDVELIGRRLGLAQQHHEASMRRQDYYHD